MACVVSVSACSVSVCVCACVCLSVVDTDEHPRPETSLDKISGLKSVFKKDGVVTAADASGICDGAGSVIVASEQAVKDYNLEPLAKVRSYGITSCQPTIMGLGSVEAIRQARKGPTLPWVTWIG